MTTSPKEVYRILIVDDEEAIRESLRLLLRAAGHEPATVGDGDEALVLLRGGSFDAAIIDLGLKTGATRSGATIVNAIEEERLRVGAVIYTGWSRADVERAFQGQDPEYAVVYKPSMPGEIVRVVENAAWLARHREEATNTLSECRRKAGSGSASNRFRKE